MFRGIHTLVGNIERLMARSRILTWAYCRPYHIVVRNELELADVRPDDTVMIVGCGSVPFTALLAARYSNARIIAVDRDPGAVAMATRVVQRSRWRDRIQVVLANGPDLEPGDASVVFLALQLSPKDETLASIAYRCNPESRIVARVPRPQYVDVYGTYSHRYRPTRSIPQRMKSFDASVLFMSNEVTTRAASA